MCFRIAPGLMCALLVAVCAFPAAGRAADERVEVIQRGKRATALVDVASREYGSAFCVDPAGFFVTNAHVVKRAAGGGGKVSLVLEPGETTQRVVDARIVRSDEAADLALLQVAKPNGLAALDLGDATGLVETTPVTAFGYPFGKALAGVGAAAAGGPRPGADDYPSVSVSTGRVTSLRKSAGQLQMVQLDASLNPGNSGGPVLDERGRVVGVVVAGVVGSGVNFAIPATKLSAFLDAPQLVFDPPAVPFARRHDPQAFVVRVVTLGPGAKKPAPAVELTLRSAHGGERRLAAAADPAAAGSFRVTAPPLPAPTAAGKVRVVATYATGSVTGLARADAPVRSGSGPAAKAVKLGDVRDVRIASAPGAAGPVPPAAGPTTATAAGSATTTLSDGSTLAGPLTGLDAVEIDLGGLTSKLDLTKARSVEVSPAEAEDDRVEYKVTASRDGKVLAEAAGVLVLTDAPAVPAVPAATASSGTTVAGGGAPAAAAAVRPPALAGDRVEVKLPATVDDVTVGGGGRFLVLSLKKLNKLAVFDASAAKIVDYIPVPPTDFRVAAGRDKLFIVLVDQKVIQRWSLNPVRRELTTTVPVDGVVQAAAMGSASDGPLLLRWAVGTDALAQSKFELFDANTLRKVDAATSNLGHYGSYRDSIHIRPSADGQVFGLWSSSMSPSGMCTIVLSGGKATSYYEHSSVGHVVPGPDGRSVFTGTGGLYTAQLRQLAGAGRAPGQAAGGRSPLAAFPATVPGFYLTLPLADAVLPPGTLGKAAAGSVCLVGNDRPLVALPELPELPAQVDPWAAGDLTLDKRVHFLAAANLLITIPATNDALVLRKFDVMGELDRSGIDYLFVTSTPPPSAKRGESYRYPIDVKSKRGGVSFKLESGPEGMTVSPAGVVTWRVPADSGEANVIITIKDASGQEVFHTFNLAYGDGPRPAAAANTAGRSTTAAAPAAGPAKK